MNEAQEIKDRRTDDKRFKIIDDRCTRIEQGLVENTLATKRVEANTEAIVEAWKAIGGGLKVLGWLGTAAKYIAYFATAVSAIAGAWYAMTHWGEVPKLPIDPPG